MKKCLLIGFLFLIVLVSPCALSFNLDVTIVNEPGIKETRPWASINLYNFSFWNPSVRAVYLEIKIKCMAAYAGQTFTLALRPFNDDTNIRRFSFNATEANSGDAFVQYLWLPVNPDGKIEYRLVCSEEWYSAAVDVNLAVRGLYTESPDVIGVPVD